jgi:hypothetical protein
MKEYLMLFRNETQGGEATPSAEQMKAVMQQWQDWIKAIADKGKYSGTNRLLPVGKTLKPGNAITDGPFAEIKEVVGGYLLVKAGSLEEAVEMAKSCPNLIYGGNVEVREVMTINGDPKSDLFLSPL